MIIWLTGLPASGKTTIAQALKERIFTQWKICPVVLDSDEIRQGLSADLGFSKVDRYEQNRRVVFICKLLVQNDITAIVSMISPYQSMRDLTRQELDEELVEVWVKCSRNECIRRDPKGLYFKAAFGEITNLTGMQDPYEEPTNPDVIVETEYDSIAECIDDIMEFIAMKELEGL